MAPRITAGAPPNAEPDQSLTQLPPPRQSTTLLRRARLSSLVACGVIACSLGFTIKGSPASPEFSAKGVPLKDKESSSSHHLEVQAFLILERIAGSESFQVSVLLRSYRRFIGNTPIVTSP